MDSLKDRARLTVAEESVIEDAHNGSHYVSPACLQCDEAITEAQLAKALDEFAKEDIDTCPCKRCVMIRSVIVSDTPNTYGVERIETDLPVS